MALIFPPLSFPYVVCVWLGEKGEDGKGWDGKGRGYCDFPLFGWCEKGEKKENRVDGVFHLGPPFFFFFYR